MAKSNEWYTPAKYIEAARSVMGGIDLDPASCALANEVVRATRYYTAEENGLMQPWYGRVWLNPPYGSAATGTGVGRTAGGVCTRTSVMRKFILRLLEGYKTGVIEQAILVVTTDTDASWFVPLWEHLICFCDHRVRFNRPGLPALGQFFGTCFVYLGPNEDRFTEVFSQFGRIVRAVDTPKPKPVTLELWEGLVA
jgi:hypothetical protein